MMAVLEHLDQAASTVQDIRAYIVDNMLLGDDSDLESNTSLLDAGILDSTGPWSWSHTWRTPSRLLSRMKKYLLKILIPLS